MIKEKIPLFVISAVFCVITFLVQRQGGTMRSFDMFPLSVRLANALVSYIAYIWKMILPYSLAIIYPHPGRTLPTWQPVIAAVVLLVLSALILGRFKNKPYLTVGWLFFLGTLLPVIGIIQVGAQAMADRYSYIPLIGLFIIIAWGAADVFNRWRYRKIAVTILAVVLLGAWTILTSVQVRHWQNSITLFSRAVDVDTTNKNYTAHNSLGFALVGVGRIEEAIEHYEKALQISPNYIKARFNLGNAFLRQQKPEEAIVQWKQVIGLEPDNADAFHSIGYALSRLGRFDESVRYYQQAQAIKPQDKTIREALAKVREVKQKIEKASACHEAANALAAQGKFTEAIAQYQQALQINPNLPSSHNNLANAYFLQGRLEDALKHYKAAIEIAPDYAEAHYNLAVLFQKQEKPDQAIAEYREALRHDPAHAKAAAALQKLLDSLGDKK